MISVMIQGGAGRYHPARAAAKETALQESLAAAWEALAAGRPAEEAVVAALSVLEADEHFNAGYGGYPNANGIVLLDVALMNGELEFASLINVRRVRQPSRVALDLLRKHKTLMSVWTHELMQDLDKSGPERKARYGWVATHEDLLSPISRALLLNAGDAELNQSSDYVPGSGTVGCVARDQAGRIAAGTSTGGINLKANGRIGDTPIIGSGVYADNQFGAISTTGHGESIMKSLLSGFILTRLQGLIRADPDALLREQQLLPGILRAEIEAACAKVPPDHSLAAIVMPQRGLPAYVFRAEMLALATRSRTREGQLIERVGVLTSGQHSAISAANE